MKSYLSKTYIKEKWNHAGFQKYFKNTGWIFFGKIIGLLITFLSTAYVARNLGPENFGQLSYAVGFVGLFGFLASLGIDQILYRDLVKYPEKKNAYLGTALTLRLFSGIITIFICVITALLISDKDVSLFLIFIISLTFVFNPFQLLIYEFQAEAKSKYPAILSIIIVIILNISKILIIFLNQGVLYLALVTLMEQILWAIGFIYLRVKFYGTLFKLNFDKSLATKILKDAFPLIFASAFFAVYARIDQVMLKHMLNTESVGIYDSAVKLSELWYFIPNIIVGSIFPAVINAKKTSDELYFKRLKKLCVVVLLITIFSALTTTLFSKYIVLTVFGAGFIGAVTILNIYIWSNIGTSLNLISQQVLLIENMANKISLTIFIGMLVNIVLNIFLIPKYGTTGAAISTLISYNLPFLSLLLFKTPRKIFIRILKS